MESFFKVPFLISLGLPRTFLFFNAGLFLLTIPFVALLEMSRASLKLLEPLSGQTISTSFRYSHIALPDILTVIQQCTIIRRSTLLRFTVFFPAVVPGCYHGHSDMDIAIYIVKKGERARAQMCYHSKKYTQKRRLIKSGPERNTLITSEAKKQKLSLSTFYSYCTTSFSVLFFVTNRPKCQRPWSCFYGALSLLDRKMPFCCPNFSFGELYKVSFFPSHGSHKKARSRNLFVILRRGLFSSDGASTQKCILTWKYILLSKSAL